MYGMNVVGIFRVSTSKRRIREVSIFFFFSLMIIYCNFNIGYLFFFSCFHFKLREELDSGSLISFDSETSPHDVASLLKEYLRDLPEPLLCRSLYPAFLSTQS